MSPQDKARGYLHAGEQLVAGFENLDATDPRELHVKLAFLPFPVGVAPMSGMRLNEAVLHAWDVQVAFAPQATLNASETDVALEQLTGPLSFMLGFLGKRDVLGGPGAMLRVETTDPRRVLGLVLAPTASPCEAPVDADGVLAGPAEALLRHLAGRLDPAHS